MAEERFVERLSHGFRVGWMQRASGEGVGKKVGIAGSEILANGLGADMVEQAFVREVGGEVGFGEGDQAGGSKGAPSEGEQAGWSIGASGELEQRVDLRGETGEERVLITGERADRPESRAAAIRDGKGVQEAESAEGECAAVGGVEAGSTTQARVEQGEKRGLNQKAEPTAIDERPG